MKKFYILTLTLLFIAFPDQGCGQFRVRAYNIEKKGLQGYLGVEVQDVNKKLKEKRNLNVDQGAYIIKVIDNSPADNAGLLKGDVIVRYNDKVIEDSQDLTKAVRKTKPKTEVKIEIIREGEKKVIPVRIGKVKKALAFNYDFEEPELFIEPNIPKLSKKFDIQIFTENKMYGLKLQTLTKQLGKYFGSPNGKGVLVSEVEEGSEAEKAGFMAGDVIIKINGNLVRDVQEFTDELSEVESEKAEFEIIRNGKSMKLSMQIENEDEDDDLEDM